MANYEVVIIGGGIAGLSLAYFRARIVPSPSWNGRRRSAITAPAARPPSSDQIQRAGNLQTRDDIEGLFRSTSELQRRAAVKATRRRDDPRVPGSSIDLKSCSPKNANSRLKIERLTKDEALARVPILIPTMSQPPSTTRISGTSRSRTFSRATSRAPPQRLRHPRAP